ncbi:DHHA1 domain-containing protein [Pendulispora albinea]|uniref:DHHA1 domain-containing protein n=1 Tax=Pendulispora albinea TaxID=2741071 RepID=A0ABZ2M389_9BACT
MTAPSPTKKLYWDDPFATTFEARPSASTFQGRPSIVLDRTLFYPEAGGQLADRGILVVTPGASGEADGDAELSIVDVQVDDDGVIHHLCDQAAGATLERIARASHVRGAIQWDRRRDHMAQHTAQHMLSQALVQAADADTVSARLGATSCTIDIDVPNVDERDLARAEDRVNTVIRDDVIVRQLFPTDQELAALVLRRAPKVSSGIRLIEVEGFDLTPCGGTHCTRTGQIGVVRITSVERYKGKIRLSFHAAGRALIDMRDKERALSSLARDLTCGPLDVTTAVDKLRAELKARTEALTQVRGELAGFIAERALAEHAPRTGTNTVIALLRENDDLTMLRTLSGKLTARADVIALTGTIDRDSRDLIVIVQRGANADFDCGTWFKTTAKSLGGRGGGNKERAEGRFPPARRFEDLVNALPTRQDERVAG